MTNPEVRLKLIDAAELAETLTFISQWLTGTDHAQLADSFGRCVGADGYNLTALRTDLTPRHPACSPSQRRTTMRLGHLREQPDTSGHRGRR